MATKKENLKGMAQGDLEKKLTTLQENLRVVRFKAEGAKSKNVKEASALRKQIAQTLTALSQSKK